MNKPNAEPKRLNVLVLGMTPLSLAVTFVV